MGQFCGVSPGSQIALPQNDTLQSCGQVRALSGNSQILLPQPGMQPPGGGGPPGGGTQGPQSRGQFSVFSPPSHKPLPQKVPIGQSFRHEVLFSPAPQIPSPQKPQSGWHVRGFSGGSQARLPQTVRQSSGQVAGVSFRSGWQTPSPQVGAQSLGQFKDDSPN
jgi:hypothetical protein